jgi:hypothetical protein
MVGVIHIESRNGSNIYRRCLPWDLATFNATLARDRATGQEPEPTLDNFNPLDPLNRYAVMSAMQDAQRVDRMTFQKFFRCYLDAVKTGETPIFADDVGALMYYARIASSASAFFESRAEVPPHSE